MIETDHLSGKKISHQWFRCDLTKSINEGHGRGLVRELLGVMEGREGATEGTSLLLTNLRRIVNKHPSSLPFIRSSNIFHHKVRPPNLTGQNFTLPCWFKYQKRVAMASLASLATLSTNGCHKRLTPGFKEINLC